MKTYKDLNVNQRINAKAHCLIFYHAKEKPLLQRVYNKFADMYFPYDCLFLESPGVNNNRNYDGPGDNYYSDGFSMGEFAERMAGYQRLK